MTIIQQRIGRIYQIIDRFFIIHLKYFTPRLRTDTKLFLPIGNDKRTIESFSLDGIMRFDIHRKRTQRINSVSII